MANPMSAPNKQYDPVEVTALSPEGVAVALTDALEALTSGTITQWLYRDAVEPLTPRMRDAIDVFLIPVERNPRTRRSR